MVYDEKLATRIQKLLKRKRNITEKKMFGGIAFLLGGKMFCGIKQILINQQTYNNLENEKPLKQRAYSSIRTAVLESII